MKTKNSAYLVSGVEHSRAAITMCWLWEPCALPFALRRVGCHSRRPPETFLRQPGLTLAFTHDGELHAERMQDGIDGFKTRVGACAQIS